MTVVFSIALSSCYNNYGDLIDEEERAYNSGEPGVTISSPGDNEYLQTLEKDNDGLIISKTLVLKGYANDGYSMPIEDDSRFTWTSDRDGSLGSGREFTLAEMLSPGTHTITLEATDDWENSDSRSVTVFVPNAYVEDFSTTLYHDAAGTTGLWDTGTPAARLGPATVNDRVSFIRTEGSSIGDGGVNKIAISGNYAYVADGFKGLAIIDISNPDSPKTTATLDIKASSIAQGIALSGNYAYIAYGESGLVRIDISDPYNPVEKNRATLSMAFSVTVSGDYAYVYMFDGGTKGFRIYNISNPEISPVFIGQYTRTNHIRDLKVKENRLFLLSDIDGLEIFDCSDKLNISLIGSYTGIHGNEIAISGNYAYIADSLEGLLVVDISDPATPVLTGSYGTPSWAVGLTVVGSRAYVACGTSGIMTIDISNPMQPRLFSSYDTPGKAKDVSVSGNFAYVADPWNGVEVFALRPYPLIKTSCNITVTPQDVTVDGNLAYVAGGDSGLEIIDISNPAAPVSLSSFACNAEIIKISGNYAYIAARGDGLVILDVSNPSSPVLKGTYTDSNGYGGPMLVTDVDIRDNYAYITCDLMVSYQLRIIDITDPAEPIYTGASFSTYYTYQASAISGNYAFMTNDFYGFVVIDISDPSGPVKKKTSYFPHLCVETGCPLATDITISGNYLYLSTDTYGLLIYDISDPLNPQFKSTFNIGGKTGRVHIVDNLAYAAIQGFGLVIIDVSNPVIPRYMASVRANDTIQGHSVTGDNIYLAAGSEGLIVAYPFSTYDSLFSLDKQIIQSLSFADVPVQKARLYTEYIQDIRFSTIIELSNRDGDNWIPTADSVLVNFISEPDSTLRWRATLRTDDRFESPVIKKTAVEYWE